MICFRQPSGNFSTNGRKKIVFKKKCVLWNVNVTVRLEINLGRRKLLDITCKASRVVASISIWIGQPTTHQNGCVFKCKRISVD